LFFYQTSISIKSRNSILTINSLYKVFVEKYQELAEKNEKKPVTKIQISKKGYALNLGFETGCFSIIFNKVIEQKTKTYVLQCYTIDASE